MKYMKYNNINILYITYNYVLNIKKTNNKKNRDRVTN